jgi:hypothetical protein
MKALMDYENHPYLSQHKEEAKTVLKHINREMYGDKDHEAGRWRDLKDYLNKNLPANADGSPAIKTIWGKGGKAFGALNYGIVINDKYLLSAYSQHPDKSGENSKAYRESQRTLNNIVLDTLKKHMGQAPAIAKAPEAVDPVAAEQAAQRTAARRAAQRPKVYILGDSHAHAGSMKKAMRKRWGDLGYDVEFKTQDGRGWGSLKRWIKEVEEAGDASRVIVAAMGGNVAKDNRWEKHRPNLESAAGTLGRLQEAGIHVDYFGLPYSARSQEYANKRRSVEDVQKEVLAKYGINYISMLDQTRPDEPMNREDVGTKLGVELQGVRKDGKEDWTHYRDYTNYADYINNAVLKRNPHAKYVSQARAQPGAGPIPGLKPAVMKAFNRAFMNPTDPDLRKWVVREIEWYKNVWNREIGEELQRRWDAANAAAAT